MRLLLLLGFLIFLASCKQAKNSTKEKEEMSSGIVKTSTDKRMQEILDSIRAFKPMKLSINEEHSDVDELIPLGNNNHGTFAYLINENSGGASGLHFGILPTYEDFSLQARLDMDEENDSILVQNKELIYHALASQKINLLNSIQKISPDSLQNKFGIKFEVKKTYGPPHPAFDPGKKTLSSVLINYRRGDSPYPTEIIGKNYPATHGTYDVYISDYLVLTGEEGTFGFVVLVTESLGFEGYTRKSIELISLGTISGGL